MLVETTLELRNFLWNFLILTLITRAKSTPDPDIAETYRDTTPISIVILLCESMPSSWLKVVLPHHFLSRYGSHLYRDTLQKHQ